jgi:lactate dehydrogenase-like 2-hydroxyacid dehydrogenase
VKDAEFVDFETLCKESDFIIVTCALTPETKEIFDEKAFSLMKSNCVFVNTSRGGNTSVDQFTPFHYYMGDIGFEGVEMYLLDAQK